MRSKRFVGCLRRISTTSGVALLAALSMVVCSQPQSAYAAGSIDYGVWAGWVADGAKFSTIYGSWKEAKIQCAGQTNTVVGSWLGFDGWDSDTVEQMGTSAHCINGVDQHYAWWEFYPEKAVYLPASKYDVEPGDILNASIKSDGRTFVFTMTNQSTQHAPWRFTITKSLQTAMDMSSVEWAVEAPDTTEDGDSLEMPPFSPYYFFNCSAVSNGKLYPLSSLKLTHAEIKNRARISNVGAGGKSFTVTSAR